MPHLHNLQKCDEMTDSDLFVICQRLFSLFPIALCKILSSSIYTHHDQLNPFRTEASRGLCRPLPLRPLRTWANQETGTASLHGTWRAPRPLAWETHPESPVNLLARRLCQGAGDRSNSGGDGFLGGYIVRPLWWLGLCLFSKIQWTRKTG